MRIQSRRAVYHLRQRIPDAPDEDHDRESPVLELLLEQEQEGLVYHALQDLRAHTLVQTTLARSGVAEECQNNTWYQPSIPSFWNTL